MSETITLEDRQLVLQTRFYPSHTAETAGRMVIRDERGGSSFSIYQRLSRMLVTDALGCRPPVELSESDIKIAPWDPNGESYQLEADIPVGHIAPEEYIPM